MAKILEWIKAHYDRVTLIAAATFLFISAIAIWWSVIQFGNRLVTEQQSRGKTASQPAVAVELDHAAQQLEQPAQWKGTTRSGLFVPERHFIGADGLPATLQNTQVHPPVPNDWFEKYHLPIEDADVLDEDPDKDGFTNLDEWQGGTDPADPNSHPDYLTKLHLVSATEEPFRYIFSSRSGDRFGINTIDESEVTQFLKVGDVIRGTEFKIVNFTEKHARNKYGINADVSELLLEHEQSHIQVTLVKREVATSPQSIATFVYTWGGRREFEVRKDQEFSLKPLEDIKYKLVDVQSDKAVIVNTQQPNAPIEIGFAAP
ncbi:MAG: hypothetical protein DMF24_02680 [Verrucomicrobia bacterium]|nr:MAG: hypothetical protein DME90_06580 [Verrucomicrobiota bacterium]PYL62808.1 MAG: hypothetical protein DMF24_02680 [Verrucomicrobiota bacterium]